MFNEILRYYYERNNGYDNNIQTKQYVRSLMSFEIFDLFRLSASVTVSETTRDICIIVLVLTARELINFATV